MEIYELSQGEQFLIEVIRFFRFLRGIGYEYSGFDIGREPYVEFRNHRTSHKIMIIWEEYQELNVLFERKLFLGVKTTNLKEVISPKRPIISVKTLAELIQSDYLHLVQ
nr:hypothetical protein [uncultured Bacteroides sp.]